MKTVLKAFIFILCVLSLLFLLKLRTDAVNVEKAEAQALESAEALAAELAAATPTPEPVPVEAEVEVVVVPTPTPEPQPEYFTISCIGDCTLWSNQNYANHPAGYAGVINGDFSYPFANTVQYFENDDYTLANLECILSDTGLSYDTSRVLFPFIAPTEYANIITSGKVDFVTTANNHMMDCWEAGAESTYAVLDYYGIPYGKEKQAQIVTTESGLKLGIYCAGTDMLPNKDMAVAAVQQLKAEGAEYIICMFHWGQELYYEVSASQRETAHACIDAGADLIYGSHPHCLQPVEVYNNSIILYSMGNWTFGGNTMPSDPDTAIAQIKVMRDLDGTVSNADVNLIPCCVSSRIDEAMVKAQNYNDYKPTPYPEDSEGFARVMAKLTGEFKPTSQGADYSNWYASRAA